LILAIKLQNRVLLTIKLSKPFIFGHLVVLKGGFADVDDKGSGAHRSASFSLFSFLFLSLSLLWRSRLSTALLRRVATS
jgi:hypothetical protein